MISKREFYFQSSDRIHRIYCREWIPEGKVRGTFQLVHGMVEFIDRYDEMASFLAEHGYYVAGCDLLGHGKSVNDENEWGFFAEKDPEDTVLSDLHCLSEEMKKRCPEGEQEKIPFFILGHSMGSFFVRKYICTWGKELDGVVLSGTGNEKTISILAGRSLNSILELFFGQWHRSKLIANMMMGSNNKKIPNAETRNDWLSKDKEIVKRYNEEPADNFLFTINGNKALLNLVFYITRKKNAKKVPTELPMIFLSGQEDPIGDYGEGVKRAFRLYAAKKTDLELKMFEGDRHEIFNETDREEVYSYLLDWAGRTVKSRKK